MGPKPLWEVTPEQWEWIFGVNIFGVINGIRTLVPRMTKHGEAGHVVNTASIGGLQVNPKLRNGSYAMTKYAVVAASEALALDLEGSNLGVSVLCPAMVATTLYASSQRRPERLGGPFGQPNPEAARRFSPRRGFSLMMSAGACSMRSRRASSSSSPMRSRANGSRRGTSG